MRSSMNDPRKSTQVSDPCCGADASGLAALEGRQRRVLEIVLGINAVMFVLEFGGGLWADSSALLADSLDMLGDSLVYGLSLFTLTGGERQRAGAALFKGGLQAAFGLGVAAEIGGKILHGGSPSGAGMFAVGGLALAANGFCLALLTRHRRDDLNMESVWLCSRNDVIGNTGVLLGAGLVVGTGSFWPDVAIGAVIAVIFLNTSVYVIRSAVTQRRALKP